MTLSISSLMEIYANEDFGKKKHPHETNELFLRCQHAQDSQMGCSGPNSKGGWGWQGLENGGSSVGPGAREGRALQC